MTAAAAVTFYKGRLQVPRGPQHPDLRATIAQAQGQKQRRDGTRWWTVPYADAPSVVTWADLYGLPVDDTVRAFTADQWRRELRNTARATATAALDDVDVSISGLRSDLLPAQNTAVRFVTDAWLRRPGSSSSHRAMIVADEMGLGKTITALATLRADARASVRAVIVCPTSLTSNWVNEIEEHFEPGAIRPWIATTKTPEPPPTDVDTVIIGWDILPEWTPTLLKWNPDAIVADEAHYSKSGRLTTKEETRVIKDADGNAVRDDRGNVTLERTRKKTGGSVRASALLDLATAVRERSGLTLALTGTPIINRPLELLALLQFTGLTDMFGGSTAYQYRYCGPKTKRVNGKEVMSFTGATNLVELNTRLTMSGHFLRRRKLTLIDQGSLQPKIVDGVDYYDHTTRPNPWTIQATDTDMAPYHAAETGTRAFFTDHAHEIARQQRQDVNSAAVRRRVGAAGTKNLRQIAALREAAAMVKVPYIVAKVRQQAEAGEKVIIAAHHRAIVDAYADEFTGLKIQGGMGAKKIEDTKRLFNETPAEEHPVLVLSVDAGKTGHTLCKQPQHDAGPACATMVFAEQVWTPGDEAQAQDRIWRIGQDRRVRIVNALLENSIDMDIFAQRAKKRAVVDAAIDAVRGTPVSAEDIANAESERDSVALVTESLVYNPRNSDASMLR